MGDNIGQNEQGNPTKEAIDKSIAAQYEAARVTSIENNSLGRIKELLMQYEELNTRSWFGKSTESQKQKLREELAEFEKKDKICIGSAIEGRYPGDVVEYHHVHDSFHNLSKEPPVYGDMVMIVTPPVYDQSFDEKPRVYLGGSLRVLPQSQ